MKSMLSSYYSPQINHIHFLMIVQFLCILYFLIWEQKQRTFLKLDLCERRPRFQLFVHMREILEMKYTAEIWQIQLNFIPTFSQATVCLDPVRSPFFWKDLELPALIYSLTEQSYVVPHCFEFPSSNRSQSITLTSTLALALTNSIVAHLASSELLLSIFYSLLKLHFLKT